MDGINVLKNELFRPVATLIVPGSIAFFPYALLIAALNSNVVEVWEKHNGVVVALFLMLSLASGMIIENIGSLIEAFVDSLRGEEHMVRWNQYLGLRVQDEIIGQRYLRTIVLRLKFELSMLLTLPLSYLGFCLLNTVKNYWTCNSIIIGGFLVAAGSFYLLYETYRSAVTLDSTRKVIINSQSKYEETQKSSKDQP